MRIVLYASERDNHPTSEEVSWAELAESLTTFRRTPCTCHLEKPKKCPHKSGPAWCAAVVEGRRSNENTKAITVAVFDVDHVSMTQLEALIGRVDAAGYAAIVHSTHSHRPPEDCCVRLVLMLSRDCTPAEWPKVRAAAISKLGIPADPKTRDLARLYFLPSAPEGAEVIALHEAGELRQALSVDTLLQDAEAPAAPPKSVLPSAQVEPLAAVPEPEAGPVDLQALRLRLRSLDREESKELARKILKGEPLAEEGARDDTLNRAVSLLACALPPEVPDEAILEILRPAVLGMPNPEGEDWMALAAYKLSRARERRAENDAKRAEFKDGLKARLRLASSAADPPSPKAPEGAGDAAPAPEDDPTAAYTDEQVEAWAREHGCATLEEFSSRLVIQRGRAFFVFVGGRYKSPIGMEELDLSLPRDLSRAPFVDLYFPTKDGEFKAKSAKQILKDHGTVARHLQASIALQRSRYDAASETFHEAVCPLRPLQAVEHPEIQAWLELLGGEQKGKLLDWVSTVMRLDRQSCALYFDGKKGVGKSLFATGLARLWHSAGPSSLIAILGGFQDVITQCPLVFADEAIPNEKGITGRLRELIGSTSRSLNRKFLPACSLDGAVRLVLAGNNDRLLNTGEDLSADDLDAVAGRFLYVHPDPAAAEFLQGLGGPPVIDSWIRQDRIAEHALWLQQTRAVDEAGRFLVSGVVQGFHERLAVGSGLANHVCEWLVRYLSDPATLKTPTMKGTILVGEGEVWVNTEALAGEATWKVRVPAAKVPGAAQLGRTLSNLSIEPLRVKIGDRQVSLHRLKPALLLTWAERALVGDLEGIRARITAPNEIISKALRVRGIGTRALEVIAGGVA